MDRIILKQISSLEKIFLQKTPSSPEQKYLSGLRGDRLAYQIAYTMTDGKDMIRCGVSVKVRSPLKKFVKIRTVGNVPSELPAFMTGFGHDDYYHSVEPGLFPDPLFDVEHSRIHATADLWHSLFVTVDIDESIPAGEYPIDLVFEIDEPQWYEDCPTRFANGRMSQTMKMTVKVIDATLPKLDIIFSQWFHADCISSYYDVKAFSAKHWILLEKFIKMAADNGMNTILTPIVTPALDTYKGHERPTVQLVDITLDGDRYAFGFEKFDRWVALCKKCGIENFEMAHLFTQWGAEATPKIIATVDGRKKRIFGWDVASDSAEYCNFLSQFLPALVERIKQLGIEKNVFFHISDEPDTNHLEHYGKLYNFVKPFISEFKIADALSKYDFYKMGTVDMPIVSINHIKPFLENEVDHLCGYYCCGQAVDVSNRFIAMPSARNRVIGTQLFKFNLKGFLQWGYNFYYSKGSEHLLNPFLTTDALYSFPSGDAFSVYPGRKGPLESLRIVVFTQALCDLRAMRLLESKIGHTAVVAIIEEVAGQKITFNSYPHTDEFSIELRERINSEIERLL